MRIGLPGALLVALSLPGMAADTTPAGIETVEVTSSDLAGIWKIKMPEYANYIPLQGAEWGPLGEHFCRMRQMPSDLTLDCLGFGPVSPWEVKLDGTNLQMTRGSMMSRKGFDGTVQSATHFSGHFYATVTGIRSDDARQAEASKLTMTVAAADPAGKSVLLTRLLDEMAGGRPLEPHESKWGGLYLLTPKDLRPLGAIKAVIYLGEFAPINGVKPDGSVLYDPLPSTVYDVEFERGELLCGIHQKSDGVLVGFRCI